MREENVSYLKGGSVTGPEMQMENETEAKELIARPPQQIEIPKAEPGFLAELWGKKIYILEVLVLTAAFWLLEFAYQYYFDTPGLIAPSLARSFALAGATLIGISLTLGPLAVLFPNYNFVEYRRSVGVAGFILIMLHSSSVLYFYFMFDINKMLWSLNPFVNAIVFGLLAFSLLFPLFLTSTDWAVRKLKFRNWKAIHRLIYIAYLFAVLHFTLISPNLANKPSGLLLILVTIMAMLLQVAGFIKRISRNFRLSRAVIVGFGIIMLYIVLFSLAYFLRSLVS